MTEPGHRDGTSGYRRAARGRADLLLFRARYGQAALTGAAHLLGYRAPENEIPAEQKEDLPDVQQNAPTEQLTSLPAEKPGSGRRFIRLRRLDPIPADRRSTEPPARLRLARAFIGPDNADQTYRPPPMLPLAPWRRLWPFLRAALGTQRLSHRLDVPRLVNGLARGRSFRRLPHLPRSGWSAQAQLILDMDLRLYPFWADFYRLVEQLHSLRGRAGLEVVCFEEGPDKACRLWQDDAGAPERPYRLPEAGTPVLILSDLGLLDGRSRSWMTFGRRLKEAGLRPVALMPCPERYWREPLGDYFHPLVWDRVTRLPRRLEGPRVRGELGVGPVPKAAESPGVERLLRLLSVAVRVEPALLRAVRHLLPAREADVGSEAAVWRHPAVWDQGTTFVLHPERQEAYRAPLDQEEISLRDQALALMRAYHGGLSPAIAHEEELIRAQSLDEPPAAETLDFFWSAVKTLFDKPSDYPYQRHLKAWVLRLADRQSRGLWSWDPAVPVAAALARVLVESYGDVPDIPFPPGFDTNQVQWVLPRHDEPQQYRLMQRGRVLYIEPPGAGSGITGNFGANPLGEGALVAELKMITTRLQWQQQVDGGPDGQPHLMDIREKREIPVPEQGRLLIHGNFEDLEIDGLEKPDWAYLRQSPDRFHLDLPGPPGRRLSWLSPDSYAVLDREGKEIGRQELREGRFIDEEAAREISEGGIRHPDWADAFGVDDYSIWAEFRYKGVSQRMRWIWPGEFLMGSPEDEGGRDANETQHRVILTQGYWLADTACTQALWEATMGKNPSHFKSTERPVENISWEDAREFCERLDRERPELGMRLPSEAEWEYACRAGKATPFSFGETVTTDQANFDGNYPYRDGPKGELRGETVDVRALPANAWGLYQMHGNVWEWCLDGYESHPEGIQVDPMVPATGAGRVLRGGGWFGDAGGLRSAYRGGGEPGVRGNSIGFRLARGRTAPGGESQ